MNGFSDDYLEDSNSDDSLSYFRPTIVQKSKDATSILPRKTANPGNVNDNSITPSVFPHRVSKRMDFHNAKKISFNKAKTNYVSHVMKGKTLKSCNLKAYGNVGGYHFLVKEEDYDKLSQKSFLKEGLRSIKCLYSTRCSVRAPQVRNSSDSTAQYWKNGGPIRIPIEELPLLSDSNIADITVEKVRSFYLKSSQILKMPMKVLLRDQRIRWHPDKMSRKCGKSVEDIRKITAVSQTINWLWIEVVNNS